ncbi:MAG: sigma-70 family RNA polymerase sigma factor [Sphingobacteriaceae bacterium]|nr:sigma-70 family RNA polymerase sigma factor [Sphingobacteriaceae bacterium]
METIYIDKNLALVHQCKTGNRKAQFELYKLYAKAMYNVAFRILNYEEEAEDVLQESFLEVFNRINDFREETTFGLWLKQIVINKSINYLRKRKLDLISTDGLDIPEEENTDESEIEFQVEKIRQAIAQLPDGYRVVLSLYLLEGYDHEEISHVLKISESTSRTQYMRAKKKLLEILKMKGK